MGKAKFDPEDLSVRDVQFAENYGLSPDQYCELKEKVWGELSGEAKEAGLKEARAQLRRDLREEIRAEVVKESMTTTGVCAGCASEGRS